MSDDKDTNGSNGFLTLLPVANDVGEVLDKPIQRFRISCPQCQNEDSLLLDGIDMNQGRLEIVLYCACGAEISIELHRFGE